MRPKDGDIYFYSPFASDKKPICADDVCPIISLDTTSSDDAQTSYVFNSTRLDTASASC